MQIYFWYYLIKGTPWPTNGVKLPSYQAHRGFHPDKIYENTLEAFYAAKRKGFEMCECDLQLSRDGIPIIYHDENLFRLQGLKDNVNALTAKELKKVANAPSLEEVLKDPQCQRQWNLEIKSKKFNDPLWKKVAQVIRAQKAEHRILISSFNPFALVYFSRILTEVPRALLVTEDSHPSNRQSMPFTFAAAQSTLTDTISGIS